MIAGYWQDIDYVAVIAERNNRLIKIRNDEMVFKASVIHYRTHPIDFIEDWLWTYDPRRDECPNMPFLLFPKQQEYITWLDDRVRNKEDGLVEKSRDMGLTHLNCAYAVWCFLFREGFKISFGSRKEQLVDRLGDTDSIFEKMRMMLRMTPREFLPVYKDGSGRSGELVSFNEAKDAVFLRIINRQNGATITGEAGDNIGRGGRSTLYFKDESAFYERPEKIDAALSQNSDVKIDVSTPNGNGNPFYRKRFSGVIPVFTFHWKDDPRKDDTWYQEQVKKYDPVIVASEIDIDYNASMENIFIPANWVEAAVEVHKKLNTSPSGSKRAGLDVADEGGDSNALMQVHGWVITDIQEWKEGTPTETARKAYDICESNHIEIIHYDSIGVGAGVKGGLTDYARYKTNPIEINGVNVGSTHLPGFWCEGKKNQDMFLNLKAQLWWQVRERFRKTYEVVKNNEEHPVDELISIPNNRTLIQELSHPKRIYTENGKIKVEPKDALKLRGIKSHNLADALMLCFAPRSTGRVGVW